MNQVADVWVTWVNRNLVALLDDLAHAVDVGEVQLRVQALGVHVQCNGDVTGTFAVAKQAALDTVGTGHQAQLGGGYAGATVVVGVQADEYAVAAIDITAEPFDLVGIDVRCCALNGSRQVEDHFVLGCRVPDLDHGVTHFLGEFQLSGAEGFWRIFECPLGFWLLSGVFDEQLGCAYGNFLDPVLVLVEYDATESRASGVVQVDDGFFRAAQRFEGAGDQVFAALGQHLDGGVVRYMAVFDQGADKVKVGLRCRRERCLDFFNAYADQGFPESQLLYRIHRLDQRLVAVTQVGAAPDRRARDGF